jgi:serine/threonine protein kinase
MDGEFSPGHSGRHGVTRPLGAHDPRQLGEYELLGRLGQGGMGTVYLGRSPDGRRVAIKVVRAEFAYDDEFRGRFRSEVTRAQQVPPFSTAEVLAADPDHDPPYLVVEYVDGPSLADVVRDKGPLTGSALQSVAVGIATALTAIHGAKVIHRDLKPDNVLFAMGGVKVIDFGIARPLDATSHHTRTDQMVGTIEYMAPERFATETDRLVGRAADIFAWGAVVAFAATGRTPFAAGSPPATAMRILTQPPDLRRLTGRLRDLVERALAKDPAARPTARELLDGLLDAEHRPSVPSQRVSEASTVPAAPMPMPPAWQTPAAPVPQAWQTPSGSVRPTPAPWQPPSWPTPPGVPDPPPGRSPLVKVLVVLAVLAALAAIGVIASHEIISTVSAPEPSPFDALQSTAPPVRPSPSATTATTNPKAVLAGTRRTLLHLAEADKDLALPASGTAKASGGTTADSVFLLEPIGSGQYLIHSEQPKGGTRCLGVKVSKDGPSALVGANCYTTREMLFQIIASGRTDDKGRPTYVIRNDDFGTVQFIERTSTVFVETADGDAPATTFSFVDRGAS